MLTHIEIITFMFIIRQCDYINYFVNITKTCLFYDLINSLPSSAFFKINYVFIIYINFTTYILNQR